MNTTTKVLLVAIPFAILGFMLQPSSPLGAAIWPAQDPAAPQPTSAQLPLLIIVSVLEALAFGAGFAFLAFGRSALANAPGATSGWASAAYFAIAWGLVSWVPHSSMHITNGADDFGRLILIEYLFHVTLIFCAGILAMFFVRVLRGSAAPTTKVEARDAAGAAAR